MNQIANSFDKVTLIKIFKGFLYALLGGAGLAGLNYVGTIHINNPLIAEAIVVFLPSITHGFVQWMKGVNPDFVDPNTPPTA